MAPWVLCTRLATHSLAGSSRSRPSTAVQWIALIGSNASISKRRPQGRPYAKRLTLAFDLIGQLVLDGEQVSIASQSFLGPCNTNVAFGPTGCLNPAPNVNRLNLATDTGTYTITSATFGLRVNPFKRLLISGSVLVKLDNGGLRADYLPIFSLSCTVK
jgi:hypothetical protein